MIRRAFLNGFVFLLIAILVGCAPSATPEPGTETSSGASTGGASSLLVTLTLLAVVSLIVWNLLRRTDEPGNSDYTNTADNNKPSVGPAQGKPKPVPARPSTAATSAATKATLSGHIFISYRRSDSADIAGRIYDRLTGRFGRDPIFKDVDSIPLGLDFKEYLDAKVSECRVLLAIIGDRWLEAQDENGNLRLDDPTDFVRIEIESALERGIPVIPLLVRGARVPAAERLPGTLKKLVYRNGIQIRADPDFHRDMDRLIMSLEKYIQS